MTGPYPAPVFVVVPVEHEVAAFNRPVTAVDFEKPFGDGFFRPSAGDAVDRFIGDFAAFLLRGLSFNHERLPDVGEVEVVIQRVCCPYLSGFDPPVIHGCIVGKMGFPTILEVEGDVGKEVRLISFYREVIVGVAPCQVVGYFPLGKKGIGSDVFVIDVDSVKQRDGCLDLVGAFGFFIPSPQTPHFFWV